MIKLLNKSAKSLRKDSTYRIDDIHLFFFMDLGFIVVIFLKLRESVEARVFLRNFFLLVDKVQSDTGSGYLLRSSTFSLIRCFISWPQSIDLFYTLSSRLSDLDFQAFLANSKYFLPSSFSSSMFLLLRSLFESSYFFVYSSGLTGSLLPVQCFFVLAIRNNFFQFQCKICDSFCFYFAIYDQ